MNLTRRNWYMAMIASCSLVLHACDKATPPPVEPETVNPGAVQLAIDPAASVNTIADQYYASTLKRTPEIAYFSGIDLPRHDGMEDNSPAARQAAEAEVDEMLAALERVDPDMLNGKTEWITHAYLLQTLKSSVAQRICRTELWNVNQMGGWHSGFSQIAQLQPVGTD